MKNFSKFAAIPVVLVGIFIGLPRVVADLLNSHTDAGLLGIVAIVSIVCGYICNRLYNSFKKEIKNED